jgi:hypothetical protein
VLLEFLVADVPILLRPESLPLIAIASCWLILVIALRVLFCFVVTCAFLSSTLLVW